MRTRAALLALALPVSLLAVAAGPADGCYLVVEDDVATTDVDESVEACELQTWFHQAETKVGNLGGIAGDVPHGVATFDTVQPTDSFTAGAGAGHATNGISTFADSDATAAVFEGSFTGAVDALEVELHVLAENVALTADAFDVAIAVDGVSAFAVDEVEITRIADPDTTAATRLLFAVTDLYESIGHHFGTGDHTIQLRVTPVYYLNDQTVFVFDAAEIDGGITFNPLVLRDETTVIN